jgi:hypothetical protein
VLLDTTAVLLPGLTRIRGASFDSKRGQVVLFGDDDQRNIDFSSVTVDDICVGARAVYSIGPPGVRCVSFVFRNFLF